jgi:hypothetical protein
VIDFEKWKLLFRYRLYEMDAFQGSDRWLGCQIKLALMEEGASQNVAIQPGEKNSRRLTMNIRRKRICGGNVNIEPVDIATPS